MNEDASIEVIDPGSENDFVCMGVVTGELKM